MSEPSSTATLLDERKVLLEISSLETRLNADPRNVTLLTRMSSLYLSINKRTKSMQFLEESVSQFLASASTQSQTAKEGILVAEACMAHWRSIRYANKEQLRLNMSAERGKILSDVKAVLEVTKTLTGARDPSLVYAIPLKQAFIMETNGQFQESIAVLSDLISAQAMEGVDLNYIIFKAAVLLKHMNGFNQALEYLEFLIDEPPESEGFTKTHVLALMALVYEQHPDKTDYVVVLGKTYDDLVEAHKSEMGASGSKRPVTNQIKIDEMLAKKSMGQSSEIWEMLALQSVDRCEYMLAFEFMQQAVEKAPNKPKLLHLLAEVSSFLGLKDKALVWAERAFALQPQSSELRNLLLVLAPGKWQDKLRNVPTSVSLNKTKEEDKDSASNVKLKKSDNDEQDGGVGGGFLGALKESTAILFSAAGGAPLSPEQKAKQIDREKRRKEKADKQAKKAKKLQEKAAAAIASQKRKVTPGKKRDPEVDGPAKPIKPFTSHETMRIFRLIRDGNKNIHVYDPILTKYISIREKLYGVPVQKAAAKKKLAR